MRTYSAKPADVKRAWHLIDAEGLVLDASQMLLFFELDEFDARHWCVVTVTWAKLQDSKIAAVALCVSRCNNIDKFVCHFFVAQVTLNLTNAMNSHWASALRFLCLCN